MTTRALAEELARLLRLEHPPVAITFHEQEPREQSGARPGPEPAGCCFWARPSTIVSTRRWRITRTAASAAIRTV
jgi:uncharacterized protein (DUF169 family)